MKVCNSVIKCIEEKRDVFIKNGYVIKECKTCGHRFSQISNPNDHLAVVYSDNYFFGGQDGYPNYLDERGILIKQGIRYAKIISKHINKPGKVLDIGSAAGFILKGFEEQGWKGFGLEPNSNMAEYGQKELNLNITVGSLESFKTDEKFDLILMIQVIGHFHDVDKAIQNARELLNPGGMLLIESWNMGSPIAKALKRNWQEYSPPSVINWFSDKTLIEFLKFYGFEFIDKGLPVKYINMKHAISLIDNKTSSIHIKQKLFRILEKSLGKLKVYYPPIDLKWYLFQKE